MKILQVATLVSPDGAYGGPVRVAENQITALNQLGHDAVLAAGTRGFAEIPDHVGDAPAKLFPARTLIPGFGFAGLQSRGLQAYVRRHGRDFDVAHVHVARDLVTLPAARELMRLGVPVVLQTHGMILPKSDAITRFVDANWTIPVLLSAREVFTLTPAEHTALTQLTAERARLRYLPNGVPMRAFRGAADRSNQVLFLARLHERKRPLDFVEAAHRVLGTGVDAEFILAGPNEGEGPTVERRIAELGIGNRVRWIGAIEPNQTNALIENAAVYVLPAVREVFPMSVLEALSSGTPTIITADNGLAETLHESGAGIVVPADNPVAIAEAVTELFASESARESLGASAFAAASTQFAMEAVAQMLIDRYQQASTTEGA